MGYTKTTWTDRVVQYPKRYTITKVGGGALSSGDTVTMDVSPGTITEAGTPITADNMNNIETGLDELNQIVSLGGLIYI